MKSSSISAPLAPTGGAEKELKSGSITAPFPQMGGAEKGIEIKFDFGSRLPNEGEGLGGEGDCRTVQCAFPFRVWSTSSASLRNSMRVPAAPSPGTSPPFSKGDDLRRLTHEFFPSFKGWVSYFAIFN